jgi:hypothetical protein
VAVREFPFGLTCPAPRRLRSAGTRRDHLRAGDPVRVGHVLVLLDLAIGTWARLPVLGIPGGWDYAPVIGGVVIALFALERPRTPAGRARSARRAGARLMEL